MASMEESIDSNEFSNLQALMLQVGSRRPGLINLMHDDPRKDYSRLDLDFTSARLISFSAEPNNKLAEYRIETEIADQKAQPVRCAITTTWTKQATIFAEHISTEESSRLRAGHDDHGYGNSFSAKDKQEP